jgi:3-oxoacyl-[acyl-carrier protein] reductase
MSASLHIWITGAGRGIGASVARHLGQRHRITLSGRNEASLQQIENMLPGGHAAVVPCDVADEASVRAAHEAAVRLHGPVDVLVNNAGIGIFGDLATMSVDEFDDQIAVNLRGVFLCTREVVRTMIARQRGLIITVNSVAAVTTFPGCTAYAASKAGALALSRSLRHEVRSHHIKVTDVLVGATDTEIWGEHERRTFGERMMMADDVAAAIGMIVDAADNPRTHYEEIIIRPQHGDLP